MTRSRSGPAPGEASYDTLGRRYAPIRRPDPHLAAAIWSALGDAESIVNVGAGTGSYEPPDRKVIAVEPSEVMIAQRPVGSAPAVRATAEALPLGDGAVDAALAVLTMQHWEDVDRGLREMLRVARQRIVLVTMDVDVQAEMWLIRDYAPETIAAHAASFPSIGWLIDTLPGASVSPLPIARNCTDGFMVAYWGRPEAYLDPAIRAGTSAWQQLPARVVDRALDRLRADLRDGEWDRRYGRLRRRDTLDVGLRLIRYEQA
jgi:SAM-dependent methyltransferase